MIPAFNFTAATATAAATSSCSSSASTSTASSASRKRALDSSCKRTLNSKPLKNKMFSSLNLKCPVCNFKFNSTTHKQFIYPCGQLICGMCVEIKKNMGITSCNLKDCTSG